MKELYVKKGDNEYEKVEFKDLLSLQFDFDGDGVLLITEENYLRLKMAVDLNDRYSVENDDNEKSAQYYIKNSYLREGHLVNDIDVIKEVCKRIDKENSTHLSVVGNRKGKYPTKPTTESILWRSVLQTSKIWNNALKTAIRALCRNSAEEWAKDAPFRLRQNSARWYRSRRLATRSLQSSTR